MANHSVWVDIPHHDLVRDIPPSLAESARTAQQQEFSRYGRRVAT